MAMLNGATLSGATLRHADLTGAHLIGAELSMAQLTCTKLMDANLTHATLFAANLYGAGLRGANFYEADLWMTELLSVDLSVALNLDKCHHLGPSSIDHMTLPCSPDLPSGFLRRCGLTDSEIEFAKLYRTNLTQEQRVGIVRKLHDLARGPAKFYSAFLSHSSADKSFVRALYNAPQDKGIRCWLHEKQLKPGDRTYERIDHGIQHWDKVILCGSRAALEESWWVDHEVEKALRKEQRIRGEEKRTVSALVPIRLDDHVFKWDGEFASEVKRREIGDFTGWRPGEAIPEGPLQQLIDALALEDAGREPPPPTRL